MISFVIPAHNESAYLGPTLTALAAAAGALDASTEVIVVDDASTDGTGDLARSRGARVLRVDLRQIGAVRNAGAAEARGDVLCFVDADTALPANTARAAERALHQGAIGGGALVGYDQPPDLVGSALTGIWNILSRLRRWAAGCFIFVRRDAFDAVGGFDTRFFAAEEIDLCQRLHARGPFAILNQRVITSTRKLGPEWASRYRTLILHTIFSGGRNLERREDLDLWYGPLREGADEPVS